MKMNRIDIKMIVTTEAMNRTVWQSGWNDLWENSFHPPLEKTDALW